MAEIPTDAIESSRILFFLVVIPSILIGLLKFSMIDLRKKIRKQSRGESMVDEEMNYAQTLVPNRLLDVFFGMPCVAVAYFSYAWVLNSELVLYVFLIYGLCFLYYLANLFIRLRGNRNDDDGGVKATLMLDNFE